MIENSLYLKYLLQSYNIPKLKEICKEYEIKGYSKLKKQELISFIIDNLSEEEIQEYIHAYEQKIIDSEFEIGLSIIRTYRPEEPLSLKVINKELSEIETTYKGKNWVTTSFLSINATNINNPERDCDCTTGANMGFCPHFWCNWLFSYRKGYFKLSEWTLTPFPSKLHTILKKEEQNKIRKEIKA